MVQSSELSWIRNRSPKTINQSQNFKFLGLSLSTISLVCTNLISQPYCNLIWSPGPLAMICWPSSASKRGWAPSWPMSQVISIQRLMIMSGLRSVWFVPLNFCAFSFSQEPSAYTNTRRKFRDNSREKLTDSVNKFMKSLLLTSSRKTHLQIWCHKMTVLMILASVSWLIPATLTVSTENKLFNCMCIFC